MGSVPQNRSATNGFHRKSAHQSGGGERGSSRKRSPPEIRAPSQPESAPRQRFAGNPHAKAAAEGVPLRRIAGERPSEQRIQRFEAGQAWFVQRKSFAGKPCADLAGVRPAEGFCRGKERAEPAGACPAAAFSSGSHALGAGETRAAGKTILRSVESSGVRPNSGFSASKSVRRGSSSGRSSPGSREPERRQRAFCFVESPENARQSSGFSASKPVRRGSSSGRASPGSRAPT